jgi:hypothetical protein
MYSRAMLGNSSNYRDGADTIHLAPITYASTSTDAAKVMQQQFGVSARRMVKRASTSTAPGHVPDVVGMGLREAVATIESKKYNVRFTGQGYVRSQQPAAGTPLRAGSKVSLILSE